MIRNSIINKSTRMHSVIRKTVNYRTNYIENKKSIKLFCHYWETPELNQPLAIVMLMHGYGEHLKWYHHVGVALAQKGFLAFGHDHFGHGLSEGTRVVVDDINDFVEDSVLHANKIKNEYPNVPTFLIGHSMGGLIAFLTALNNPDLFKGVVLNGPFLMLGDEVNSTPKKWIARNLTRLFPNLQVGKLRMNDVTGDKEMIEKISKDPLWWQGGIKLRTGLAFLNAVEKIDEEFNKVNFPFLIIHGKDDKICHPKGSENLMAASPSIDKEIKLYPGAAHHLYIDKKDIRQVAVQDTVEWIYKRL